MPIILHPLQELRLEVSHKTTIQIKLLHGSAEIFGSELKPSIPLFISHQNIAIFTWHGCEVGLYHGVDGKEVNVNIDANHDDDEAGPTEIDGLFWYVADTTPMHDYLNTHAALEARRARCGSNGAPGPKVMVVGPMDSGKTSLCKILLNYGVKACRKMLFVDIDPNEGSVSMPGTLTATTIAKPLDPEEEFCSTPVTTNLSPLAFYYGASDPCEKKSAYKALCSRLAHCVSSKMVSDSDCRTSGYIINTPYQFTEWKGMEIMYHNIDALKVNVILVLGYEKLYHILKRKYSKTHPHIIIVNLDKSGGVVNRDKEARRQLQKSQIRSYFKSCAPDKSINDMDRRVALNPFTNVIGLRDVAIRRIGDAKIAPSSALPLGADRKMRELQIIKITPGDILLHSILAVSHVTSQKKSAVDGTTSTSTTAASATETSVVVGGEEQVLKSNILGFVYVVSVDDTKGLINVMSPNPKKLGRRVLLMGDLKWIDT